MTALSEILLFVINLGLPIYLVVRWGWRGVIGGAFCMWVTVYLSGEIQRAGDPRSERFAMGVWLVAGLLFTFTYCECAGGGSIERCSEPEPAGSLRDKSTIGAAGSGR